MPKVKNPLFSQEARGGIAGLVFNTWRGINYVKTNTSPTGQGTAKRLAAQALMSTISKLWQGISDAERAGWNQYAIDHPVTDWTGSPKRLTGMNWFVMLNIQLARLGVAAVDTAPVIVAPDPLTGFAIALTVADITATWTTPVLGNLQVDFFAVGPLSAGIEAKLEQTQHLTFEDITVVQPIIIKLAAAAGRWTVFARTIDDTTGLASTWQSAFVDV